MCEFSTYGHISSHREPVRERERCIEGHNRIHTHTHSRAVSAEDQFFFLSRSRTQHHQSCRYFSFPFFLSPSDPIHAAHSVSPRALTALICEAFKGALAGWLAHRPSERASRRPSSLRLPGPNFADAAGADLHHARSLALINICTRAICAHAARMNQCANMRNC